MRRGHCLAVLAIAASLAGCGMRLIHYTGYRGDGTFTPLQAPWICQDGYTVDLGRIDLTAAGEYDYRLAGLPAIESIVGVTVQEPRPQGDADWHRPAALIELTLRDAHERIVLSRHESLRQWVRSYAIGTPERAFLYQRGTQAEIPVAPGAVRVERFPIGTDDSWGTYFTPRRDERYTLHFTVEEPDPPADLHDTDVRLQVQAVVGCL